MSRIGLEGSEYAGRTSAMPWRLPHGKLDCRRCGSSLAGRRQKVRWAAVGKATFQVEVFRCRCGAGRHARREVGVA